MRLFEKNLPGMIENVFLLLQENLELCREKGMIYGESNGKQIL
jgi:hypothetical protein